MPFDIETVFPLLEKEVSNYKVPIVDLIAVQTNDPFKVLVATILSARTKDETTALAAERLFKAAPDLDGLAKLSRSAIEKLIHPVGFFRNKAKFLLDLPEALAPFAGEVPADLDALTSLPGVGRKTANLVLSVAFGLPAICVDTHVHRITNIWGYVETKTPFETEMALREKLPKKFWRPINSVLVAFGQGTCRPVSPHCDICVIRKYCPQIGVTPRKVPQKKNAGKAASLRLLSWNVNGIRAVEKKGFIDLVLELAPDILALQETKAQPEQLTDQLKNIDGYHSYWHSAAKKGYAGVATYSRVPPVDVVYGIGDDAFDQEGRVLTLEFADFYLVNAYFPNAQHGLPRIDYKIEFNEAMLRFVDTLRKKKTVLVCGDFNVAHKAIDLANPKANENNPGFSPRERAWMDRFVKAGYIDTFRKFNQHPGQYTWWSYRFNARAKNIGWRIDYFCIDQKSQSRVLDAGILAEVMGSDHCPVYINFK